MSSSSRAALATWCMRWMLLFVLWLALVDTWRWQEWALGAVAAALAATAAARVVRPGRPRLRSRLGLARALGPRPFQPLVQLVTDSAVVTRALVVSLLRRRPLRGRFRLGRYRPDQARRSAAGRAVTEIWGSLPPNRYIVGIDEDEGFVLAHELVPSDQPLDPLPPR